jgi:hypothetical protein
MHYGGAPPHTWFNASTALSPRAGFYKAVYALRCADDKNRSCATSITMSSVVGVNSVLNGFDDASSGIFGLAPTCQGVEQTVPCLPQTVLEVEAALGFTQQIFEIAMTTSDDYVAPPLPASWVTLGSGTAILVHRSEREARRRWWWRRRRC